MHRGQCPGPVTVEVYPAFCQEESGVEKTTGFNMTDTIRKSDAEMQVQGLEAESECRSNSKVVEESDVHEVQAIRFNGLQKLWTIWWVGYMKPTHDLIQNLTGIDHDKVAEARQMQGKRVKLTGARHESAVLLERSGSMVFHHLELGSVRQPAVKYQACGGFCALNSVANVIDLPPFLYNVIHDKGPRFELENVRKILNEWTDTPCQLHTNVLLYHFFVFLLLVFLIFSFFYFSYFSVSYF